MSHPLTVTTSSNIKFAEFLSDEGVLVNIGPFIYRIRSSIPSIAANLFKLYTGQILFNKVAAETFIDFDVSIHPPSWLRRLVNKQVQFYFDDNIAFNPFPLHHATAMLEWGMNWCVSSHIHTYLIIHAAIIERNGLAAVMPAPPGSGKSTLCASLVQEGWRLLSDELTLIDLNDYKAVPLPRPIGLKNQSIELIRHYYPDAVFGVVSSDTLKGSICHLKPPDSSIALQHVTCPVRWIVFPKFEAEAKTELVERPKGQAFMEIANNAFNYSMLGVAGFDVLKNVVDRADCFDFKYSRLDEAIEVFANLSVLHEI